MTHPRSRGQERRIIRKKGLSFRDVLARDIRDLRQITGTKYAEGIKVLLEYYRENFKPSMDKAPRK